MADVKFCWLVTDNDDPDEHIIQIEGSIEIQPEGDSYSAELLDLSDATGAVIYKAQPYKAPSKFAANMLAAALRLPSVKHQIETIMAHHDAFEEQRREADREARAVARSYARSVL